MPNWCNNVVKLHHKDPAMIDRVIKGFTGEGLLGEFIPVPEDLQITAGFLGNTDEQKALELKEQANLKKHGYKNWYDYCVGEWGTKWDVTSDGLDPERNGDNNVTLTFDSAWSPPLNAYEKLEAMGFYVEAYYYEPGMQYAGIYEDGCDDCYSDWGNAQGAEEMLPETLDEMFEISEGQRMWEEEEEEDENQNES